MLIVGMPGFTAAQNRSHMSLWAISAAPLLAGNNLATMSTETRDILANREVLAINQDALGLQGTPVAEDRAGLQVWSKTLTGVGRRAVVLLNRNNFATDITARWTDLGLSGLATIRNPWTGTDVGTSNTSYTANVPAKGAVLITIATDSTAPPAT